MTTFKLYDALGVAKGASKDEIKKAFRKMAVQHHPDKGGDSEKFKEVAHAYEVLTDDTKRGQYDQVGDAGFEAMRAGGGGGGFHDNVDARHIFEQFFGGGFGFDPFGMGGGMGGGGGHGIRRADQLHQIRISLADAYTGVTKSMRICVTKVCFKCRDTCHTCQGRGQITDMRRMGFITQMMTRVCDACSGTGKIIKARESCVDCHGKGSFTEERKEEVSFPPGVQSGHQVRLHQLGEQPKAENETPGDLILQVAVQENPHFTRSGADLVHHVNISFAESMVGKKILIPHFGGPMDLDISLFGIIKPEKSYAIEGKGMPTDGGHGQPKKYGKLNIIFHIEYPTKTLGDMEKEMVRLCLASTGLM